MGARAGVDSSAEPPTILIDWFFALDRAAAFVFLGQRCGRTVSRVFGGWIGRRLQVGSDVGTAIFHFVPFSGLVVAGAFAAAGTVAATRAHRRRILA